jgi:hypothetical protein
MARKRAPGGGRKARGAGPAVHFNTRIAPEIRRQLERDAERNGHTLSREIELRLAKTINDPPSPSDRRNRGLGYLMAQIITIFQNADRVERSEQFDWRSNRFDFEAVKSAVVQLLDLLAPRAKNLETSRYTLFESPNDAGRIVASMIVTLMSMPEEAKKIREARGSPSGSIFHAFPQVAKDLNFHAIPIKKR